MKTKMQKNKKEKKFKLFDLNRDGKGVYEQESRKPTLKFFFVLLKRKFSQLLQLNLLMLPMIIPLLVIAALYLFGNKTTTVTEAVYVPLHGITTILPSPTLTPLADLSGMQMELPGFITPVVGIIIAVCILFLAVTFGWQNVGSKYVLRGLFRGDAVFVFTDYFYAIKRNFKQAFFLGLLDFICSVVLIIDFIFFFFRTGSLSADLMYGAIFAIGLIYIIMRFYMYHLLITFDLSTLKILKNSLIFTTLGIKRNVMALLGLVIFIGFHLLLIFTLFPMGISIPLVLPLVYILALCGFITTYAAYPVIDRYMIEPYQNQASEDNEAIAEDDELSEEI